tara:strand:- start:4526 stop:5716 length:1191 start_codon:yes stop_codon:yes gene_type:complete
MKTNINFEDTEVAFSLKSNSELRTALLLFKIIGKSYLTAIAKPITNFFLSIKLPIVAILKQTVFKQFCGGETIQECHFTIKEMFEKKVYSILDYSVEGKENESQFNSTLAIALEALEFVTDYRATPFIVFKGTGLGRFDLFEKVSKNKPLSVIEKDEWARVVNRFDTICNQCAKTPNIRVMIDAEESWIQGAIDNLAEDMMVKYNKNRAVVFSTVQLYRWDRLAYLKKLKNKANDSGFHAGFKLVRGAYIEKERNKAQANNYISPICSNKEETDANFNNGLDYCLNNLGVFEIFLGTHNEKSTKMLAELMNDQGLSNSDDRIWFGQLYGMSDHISFNLSKNNYNTAKYLPFGPVKDVIPYLLRRAEENTSVGNQTSRELGLIKKEISRRHKRKIKS